MIALACLDMAGTTVADDGAVLAAFAEAIAALGVERGSDRFARAERYVVETMGESKIAVFRALAGGDEASAQRANAAFEAAYARSVEAGGAVAIPGAEATIDALRDAGIRVCLTTGFSPATRDLLLVALGWRDRVDLALAPADVGGRGRPFPDMILTAVMSLGIDDVRDVAVAGDTAGDLWSGHRAGASIVAGVLTGAHDRPTLAAAPHTHLLASIVDLPALAARAG